MRKPRCALLFFVFLILGLSLGLPPEDVTETTYDESETQPYEGMPLVAVVVVQAAARTTQSVLISFHLELDAASLLVLARVHDTNVNRFANAAVSLTLLGTLRC